MVEPTDANAARRASILDAATLVFLRYGFKKTSMDDLARAAGISRQGLYLHFPTKEALFKEALLRMVDSVRAAGRAAIAREDLSAPDRILGTFEAVHGHAIGQPGAEHLNELLETAEQLVGPVIAELEAEIIADVTRVLRTSGVAADWKGTGITTKELAEHLSATSYGVKHIVATHAEYREQMRIAVKIVCRGRGKDERRPGG